MSSLVLLEWVKPTNNIVSEAEKATLVRAGEKVFAFDVDETKTSIDLTNIGIVLKRFGKAKIEKINELSVNHMDAVNLKPKVNGQETLNQQRLKGIKDMNQEFAKFFLKRLHDLCWQDFSKGVQSTIAFEDGFKMLQQATNALYDLLLASIDDKFSKDLSVSEMKNVIELHNLNNEFALGKNVKKSKK